jgi:hypothetical protein
MNLSERIYSAALGSEARRGREAPRRSRPEAERSGVEGKSR